MTSTHRGLRAFTLVEMLVVIAIIGLLLGILMPALSGVQKQSHKSTEMNNLKQVALAWNMYANNNNEAALPGFLEEDVQAAPVANVSRGWGVEYKYPNGSDIPIDPTNIAGPWTWRLLPYMDYNHDLIHGYTGEDGFEMTTVHTDSAEAQEIAYEPAFGYNGYYVGGYWTMIPNFGGGGVDTPRPMYWDHCKTGTREALQIVQSLSQMQKSSQLVIFCTASNLTAGDYIQFHDDVPGGHLVEPPTREDFQVWSNIPPENVPYTVHMYQPTGFAPIGRHTGSAAVLYGDGHIDTQQPGALLDQRFWINNASGYDASTGTTYTHQVCPP